MKESTKRNLKKAAAAGAAAFAAKQATKDLRACPACHRPVADNAYCCPHCGCNIAQLDAEKAGRPSLFLRVNVGILKYVGIGTIILVFILALLMRGLSS